jgi:cytochrome c5
MHRFALALTLSATVLLSACGKQEVAAPAAQVAAAPAQAPAPAPAPAADHSAGKSVFNKVCALCHAAGVGGAPKPGDKADWAPRIAQGNEVLYKHAIEGFTGAKGQMPARGGSATPDDDIKKAVDYMADASR